MPFIVVLPFCDLFHQHQLSQSFVCDNTPFKLYGDFFLHPLLIS